MAPKGNGGKTQQTKNNLICNVTWTNNYTVSLTSDQKKITRNLKYQC